MKEHDIAFVYETEETRVDMMDYIEGLIGKENICLADRFDMRGHTCGTQWITIRCTDKQWAEIVFQLNLKEVWAA